MPKVVSAKDKMQPKTFKLHPSTIERIKELADVMQMTQAEVINTGIKMLLTNENDTRKLEEEKIMG